MKDVFKGLLKMLAVAVIMSILPIERTAESERRREEEELWQHNRDEE